MSENDWHSQKTYDSLITYGSSAIKYVLVINGGAILALLTFLGSQAEKSSNLSYVIPIFVFGVFFGGISTICAYFTQLYLFNDNDKYLVYQKGGVVSIILGLVLFLVGALCASYLIHNI